MATIRDVDLGVCRGRAWEGDSKRVTIVLPGAVGLSASSWYAPLLGLLHRGWSAVEVVDEFLDRSLDPGPWVTERAEAALRHAGAAARTAVLAKSLGTFAAPLVAERSLPAIWLTPLLNLPQLVDALRARSAPALFVGGTADPAWDGDAARSISDDVLELEGADHGLVGADLAPAFHLATMRRIVERVDAFASRLE